MEEKEEKWFYSIMNNDYKEDVLFIKIKILYLSNEKNIEKLKNYTIILKTKNTITKEEILTEIKENNLSGTYRLKSLLLFNVDSDLCNVDDNSFYSKFSPERFQPKNVDDIIIKKSFTIFQELNELIFIFAKIGKSNGNDNDKKNLNKKIKKY